jgi:hypothetical protein
VVTNVQVRHGPAMADRLGLAAPVAQEYGKCGIDR